MKLPELTILKIEKFSKERIYTQKRVTAIKRRFNLIRLKKVGPKPVYVDSYILFHFLICIK